MMQSGELDIYKYYTLVPKKSVRYIAQFLASADLYCACARFCYSVSLWVTCQKFWNNKWIKIYVYCYFNIFILSRRISRRKQKFRRLLSSMWAAGCDDIYYKCRLIMSGLSPGVNTVSSLSSQYHGIWSNASLVLTMGLYVGGQRLGEAGGRPRITGRDVMLQNIHTLSLIYRTLIWR